MCDNVMQIARLRCPDCRNVVMVPACWGCGLLPDAAVQAAFLIEHARDMPLLHPTLLPDHHMTGRPA